MISLKKGSNWRDDSVVKHTCYSFRELEFSVQYSHDCSQLSIIPVPGDPAGKI